MKKRVLWPALTIMMLLMVFSVRTVSAFAVSSKVSKTVEVELPQDYVQCTFYVSFEKETLEDTVLVAPSGDEYSFSEGDSGKLECTVKNARQGTWKVVAAKEIDLEEDGQSEPDPDEVIGKITVNVKSEMESSSEVSQNIKIAKEIANLVIYFKDDSIVTEWDDDSCGDVNVTITNSANLQIIAKETVKNQYLEVPIPEEVDEILVNIVPASSSGVKGAGEQYVLPVSNHPEAVITFEPVTYTNKDTINASVDMEKSYSLQFFNNDKAAGGTDVLSPGSHEIEVPIIEGENHVKVYVVDEKGNMRSTAIDVICDKTPPVLKLENDINGIETYEERISFSGLVEDFDQLMFRNDGVFVDWDGSFTIDASLKEGNNTLEVEAVDEAGNKAVYSAVVTRLVKKPIKIPWITIGIVLFALVLLAVVLFMIKKKVRFSSFSVKKEDKKQPMSKGHGLHITYYIYYGAILLVVVALLRFVILGVNIKSGSMEPTIQTGELAVFNRLAYVFGTPMRGDIVAYDSEEMGVLLIKRVVGMPGDTVSFKDGYVIINGMIAEETYIDDAIETNSGKTFNVPDGCYLLLGDNRDTSIDARYWENPYAEKNRVKGKLLFHTDLLSILLDRA